MVAIHKGTALARGMAEVRGAGDASDRCLKIWSGTMSFADMSPAPDAPGEKEFRSSGGVLAASWLRRAD